MSGKVRIVADSTCDLSPALIKEFNITIVPLCVIMDDKSYYDGIEVTSDEMYRWADENKTTPKTAAITFDKTQELLKPLMDDGSDIIFFGISEDMSTTCQVARMVGDDAEYGRLFVINSMSLSTGIGLQVIRAAKLASIGKTAEEIVEIINDDRPKVRASFIVDTLTYLARGGRCKSVVALVGNAIKLHPQIVVRDGKMLVDRKYRGKLGSVLLKYAKDLEAELLEADPDVVFITHSGVEDELINPVKDYLLSLGVFNRIEVTRAGGVISSHCGPGTLGILYYMKN